MLNKITTEITFFKSHPLGMRMLLLTNLIYGLVIPIIELFVGAYIMRNSSDLSLVGDAIDISRRTWSKIRQGLFWAFAYNILGIPLAAFGYLSPVLAGSAMALSSVSVVANALLLRRWKPVRLPPVNLDAV